MFGLFSLYVLMCVEESIKYSCPNILARFEKIKRNCFLGEPLPVVYLYNYNYLLIWFLKNMATRWVELNFLKWHRMDLKIVWHKYFLGQFSTKIVQIIEKCGNQVAGLVFLNLFRLLKTIFSSIKSGEWYRVIIVHIDFSCNDPEYCLYQGKG